METTYHVYDTCWKMKDNKPTKFTVFSVNIEMEWYRQGVDVTYVIIDESKGERGHGVREQQRLTVSEDQVFDSKDALINSLLK